MRIADGASTIAARGRWRFLLFALVGGVAALVNILTRIAFNLAMPFEAAIIIAYLCGMTTAYVLNKLFVFTPSGRTVRDEYMRFTLVNLVAVVQVWIVSVALADLIFPMIGLSWHAETIAHIIGVIAPIFTSYLGHKNFSFSAASR